MPREGTAAAPLAPAGLAWQAQAACRGFDVNLFFPDGEARETRAQVADAKAVCAGCRVRRPCLEFALAYPEEKGIWGGTTEQERRVLRHPPERADRADRAERRTPPPAPPGRRRTRARGPGLPALATRT
jgi:WhiB family redox-sensing transcriptional regulator